MEKPAQNIQDSFLNNARKDKIVLTIYLMSGVKLSGRIKSFDKYSLVLETNNQEQLIFKHAISTVVTQKTSHSYASSLAVRACIPRRPPTLRARRCTRTPRRHRTRHCPTPSANGPSWSGWSGKRVPTPGAAIAASRRGIPR